MIYKVRINDKEYEVEVVKGNHADVNASAPAAAQTQNAPKSAAPAPAPAPVEASGNVVAAPMPGTILDVKVAPGTAVKKGDVVIILEAMKMENEILAPSDGVVSQIYVTKGANVNTDDPLFSL